MQGPALGSTEQFVMKNQKTFQKCCRVLGTASVSSDIFVGVHWRNCNISFCAAKQAHTCLRGQGMGNLLSLNSI